LASSSGGQSVEQAQQQLQEQQAAAAVAYFHVLLNRLPLRHAELLSWDAMLCVAAGVVSFSRLGALDDMNVDLTEQLLQAKQKQQQQQQAAAAAAAASQSASAPSSSKQQQPAQQQQQPRQRGAAAVASPSYQYKDLPSKNEARRYACGWYVAAAELDCAGHVICIVEGAAAVACSCVQVELAATAAEQQPKLRAVSTLAGYPLGFHQMTKLNCLQCSMVNAMSLGATVFTC
jgi:hypothetical protein